MWARWKPAGHQFATPALYSELDPQVVCGYLLCWIRGCYISWGDSSGLLYPSDLSFIVETNQKKKKKLTQPQITLNSEFPGGPLIPEPFSEWDPVSGLVPFLVARGSRLCWWLADDSSGGLAGELISLRFVPRVKLIVIIIFFVSGVRACASTMTWQPAPVTSAQQCWGFEPSVSDLCHCPCQGHGSDPMLGMSGSHWNGHPSAGGVNQTTPPKPLVLCRALDLGEVFLSSLVSTWRKIYFSLSSDGENEPHSRTFPEGNSSVLSLWCWLIFFFWLPVWYLDMTGL